jgi:hypothetical protein
MNQEREGERESKERGQRRNSLNAMPCKTNHIKVYKNFLMKNKIVPSRNLM